MDDNSTPERPVAEDLRFQDRMWAAERISWKLLAGVVLAALLGLFASGFLSTASVATADGAIEVRYQRFARQTARSNFTIAVRRPPAPETRMRLSPGFLEYYEIESLYPQPLRSAAGASGLELVFARSAAGDLSVHITGHARRFGAPRIAVTIDGVGSLTFRQFIYP